MHIGMKVMRPFKYMEGRTDTKSIITLLDRSGTKHYFSTQPPHILSLLSDKRRLNLGAHHSSDSGSSLWSALSIQWNILES